jgi:hypothetical protein
MRNEYQLTSGRKNPYVDRLGTKGRAELLKWWSDATSTGQPCGPVPMDDFAHRLVSAGRLLGKARIPAGNERCRSRSDSRPGTVGNEDHANRDMEHGSLAALGRPSEGGVGISP